MSKITRNPSKVQAVNAIATALNSLKSSDLSISVSSKFKGVYFDRIGKGIARDDIMIEPVHYEQELLNLNKTEQTVLKLLLEQYDYKSGYCFYTPPTTAKEKRNFSNGYVSLNTKNLVKRIRKGVYLINPVARLPRDELIDRLIEIYADPSLYGKI